MADRAAGNKTAKYIDLAKTLHFIPIAVETGDAFNELALKFVTELEEESGNMGATILVPAVVGFIAERECSCIQEHIQS